MHRGGGPHPPARRGADVSRARHARSRPRPARLHLPARERRARRRGDHHPRPRGSHGRAGLPAAGDVLSDLRLRADARPGPQPHRGGGPARPNRADPRVRRRAAEDRPVRGRVHSRHPLGAARLRHRVPHAAGHDPPQWRLQARPHAGRRPAHRPRAHRRPGVGGRRTPAAERLHQRRGARLRPQRDLHRRGAPRAVPPARGPPHRHRLLRQPHPPRAADRGRRHGVRAQGGDAGDVDEEERAAGSGHGFATHPRPRARRHRRRRATCPRARCA